MSADKSLKCPHCEKEFSLSSKAITKAQTTLSLEMKPDEGHMLSAATVGGVLTNFEKAMKSMSKDMGTMCMTLIKGMELKPDGNMRFHFLIVTAQSDVYQQHAKYKSKNLKS